jgi:hypothetical protein
VALHFLLEEDTAVDLFLQLVDLGISLLDDLLLRRHLIMDLKRSIAVQTYLGAGQPQLLLLLDEHLLLRLQVHL